MTSDGSVFSLSRAFDAPRDNIWDAWTNEAKLKKWFGPKGCPIIASTQDFKVGGFYHYGMDVPGVTTMWGKWVFREIEKPSRIVWHHSFSDAEGKNMTRHPFSNTWPLEMVCTLALDDMGQKTKLTLSTIAINTTDVERKTWEEGMAGMTQGWGGTLDQLAEFL